MFVIRDGRKVQPDFCKTFKGECIVCDCKFTCEDWEVATVIHIINHRQLSYYIINCPCCEEVVFVYKKV